MRPSSNYFFQTSHKKLLTFRSFFKWQWEMCCSCGDSVAAVEWCYDEGDSDASGSGDCGAADKRHLAPDDSDDSVNSVEWQQCRHVHVGK